MHDLVLAMKMSAFAPIMRGRFCVAKWCGVVVLIEGDWTLTVLLLRSCGGIYMSQIACPSNIQMLEPSNISICYQSALNSNTL